MNDKELLELAAKAASVPLDDLEESWDGIGNYYRAWNPLADDGEALRLAVNLGLDILVDDKTIEVNATRHSFEEGTETVAPWAWEALGDDPYAATRRAIVRVAAEIGRRMQTLQS